MTEQRTRMKIGIDGKVYTLDTGKRESLTQIPWESRKKVIAVLEAIKQAEHVETAKTTETAKPAATTRPPIPAVKPAAQAPANKISQPEGNSKDADAIMQQLIMQQPSHNIPDKAAVIKWLVVFFAVIMALVLLFG